MAEKKGNNHPSPARLHAILARDVARAVVFRRGPSGEVCILGWDLNTDKFMLGQWFRGRIYEYRSDLSPDGSHLIYFATDFRRPNKFDEYREELRVKEFGPLPAKYFFSGAVREQREEQLAEIDLKYAKKLKEFQKSGNDGAPSWTAISRVPFLKATDLWFNGSCWNGGGLFLSNKKVWLNKPFPKRGGHREALRSKLFQTVTETSAGWEQNCGECPGVYLLRLERDGWEMKTVTLNSCLFEKNIFGGWVLRKEIIATVEPEFGHGEYFEQHKIIHIPSGAEIDGKLWNWADYDVARKRILYACDGKLFSLPLNNADCTPQLLANLNSLQFESRKAPY